MSPPRVRGWCPGARRPMRSGDGLIVRVRPRLARLDRAQALGLADLAMRFGHGTIDLTNRANLQIRGVADGDLDALLEGLDRLGLLDPDPDSEARRNLIVAPTWEPGDATHRLALAFAERLRDLPDLPAKFGFAIDAGPQRSLIGMAGDVRIETAQDGGLIVRADGAETGRAVDEDAAIDAAIGLARWFVDARPPGGAAGRMARLLRDVALPGDWTGTGPATGIGLPQRPGRTRLGPAVGLAFGQIGGAALAALVTDSGASGIRLTPWRCLILEAGGAVTGDEVITRTDDPRLATDACPGAPCCPRASVETRALARRLAPHLKGNLHVSGCDKGCARPRPADITLVGRDGKFDLVLKGAAWDEPRWRGFAPEDLIRKLS